MGKPMWKCLRDVFPKTRNWIEVVLRKTETRIDDAQLRAGDGPDEFAECAALQKRA